MKRFIFALALMLMPVSANASVVITPHITPHISAPHVTPHVAPHFNAAAQAHPVPVIKAPAPSTIKTVITPAPKTEVYAAPKVTATSPIMYPWYYSIFHHNKKDCDPTKDNDCKKD